MCFFPNRGIPQHHLYLYGWADGIITTLLISAGVVILNTYV